MMQLSETMLRYLKTAEGGDAQARMDVEAQLRGMNALVDKSTKAQPQNGSLLDGSVISVKEEWSFVVGNFGAREGVKIGMPLRVKRGDDVVARLRVVDVRERMCGGVIQECGEERSKVGNESIVGEEPTMKRMMARARGSGSRILKRSSHIGIVLTDEIKIETRETRKAAQKAAKKKGGEAKTEGGAAEAKAEKPKRAKK